MTLKVTEIYKSVQGESSYAGLPCTFIRMTGCPLRCRWCDTAYAFEGGEDASLETIMQKVKELGVHLVELTGGEPLAQKGSYELANHLSESGYKVLIETGGSEPIAGLHQNVHVIMDIKCPGSKMDGKNLWSNIELLKPTDEVKFVVASKEDFSWAVTVCEKYDLEKKCRLLFSPAFGLVQPKDLVEWLLESGANARLNLQQHKFIWHPRAKGV